MPRKFYGVSDVQHITLYPVFPATPVSVSSPVEASRETCVCVEGPEEHLSFLYPHLINLVKQSSYREHDRWGTWMGVQRGSQGSLVILWYQFGTSLMDRIELLEHKFRRDLVFYSDLKLADMSFLEVVCFGHTLLKSVIGLPEELERNGTIVFPHVSFSAAS